MCVDIWRLEEDIGYPIIFPFALVLRRGILLGLELGWQPVSPSVPPVSASQRTRMTSTPGHT